MSERTNRETSEGSRARGAARIHLIVGPVGAGKSTFALRLAREQRALRLNLDEWMAALFRPDRPETGVMEWYVERTRRCVRQIWTLTERLLEAQTNVVLEIGLIQRRERELFFEQVDAGHCDLTVYVVDAPRELRRQRVQQRNAQQGETFSMLVPPEIFELASDLWEPLDERECAGRDVRFV
jgi:predicted kinase